MSRYNLADTRSSTLLFTTDSVAGMIGIVQDVIHQDGTEGLVGLSLSVHDTSGEVLEFDDEGILSALNMGPVPARA